MFASLHSPLTPVIVTAAPPREGYSLTPTLQGHSGIGIQSEFMLSTPPIYDSTLPSITIDGQPQPIITRRAGDAFTITPAVPLSHNGLYIFRLARNGQDHITWAFQTTVRFEIISVFPRNESTNVPVNTAIEIEFAINEDISIENFFSIYPYVEGRFERHENRVVFMPFNPLTHSEVYTITIAAGIELPSTNEVIAESHIFSFETAPIPTQNIQNRTQQSTVRFSNAYIEFPSFEPPTLNFRVQYNSQAGITRPIIDVNVYQFHNSNAGVNAAKRLLRPPSWAHQAWRNNLISTSELENIMSFYITEPQNVSRWGVETLGLPYQLPEGFYLVQASIADWHSQMVIQITDLAVQVVADGEQTLLWINDMQTGRPVVNAQVYDPMDSREFLTDAHGIAIIDRPMPYSSYGDRLTITSTEGMESVLFFSQHFRHSRPSGHDRYWTALQLDRTLFQRDDTVSFWGFVQNRQYHEDIQYVTVVLTSSWWRSGGRPILQRQVIPVSYSAYSGEMQLPHLDPGFYNLTIYHGDLSVGSMFFSVEDYVTPPYQLLVIPAQHAIFAGEDASFMIRTEFFEGTPVAGLDVTYWASGWNLTTNRDGNNTTNIDGEFEISTMATVSDNHAQGQTTLNLEAHATLPEVGWVMQRASTRVFINDIYVQSRAVREDTNANLSLNVHSIILDRLNDGTAQNSQDFLDTPVAGQEFSVVIQRIYWERIRDGERYDNIERRVIPRYRSVRREEEINRFTLVTDTSGAISHDFQVPNRARESYSATITTTDGNGRQIMQTLFIGRDFTSFYNEIDEDRLSLYGARPHSEGYDIGDEVRLSINRGLEPLTSGNFLFVAVQDGILHYHVGSNAFVFNFDEMHLPNATVYAFFFNGHIYYSNHQMRQELRFNSASRNLVLTVETCQDRYKPGDMATLRVTAHDNRGNPKAASVNIGLVDEALFALRDYNVNTLNALYRTVNGHLHFIMTTHRTFASDGIDIDVIGFDEESEMILGEMWAASDVMFAPAQAGAALISEETHIREIFEDTAVFATIRTNAQGEATFTFRLPDNITSWRMTISGISEDLYAGNLVESVIVTQPMFLNYALNSVFLVGDIPTLGINVYGTALNFGDNTTIQVRNGNTVMATATGHVFDRINIPLWELTEVGDHTIVIYATAQGYSDAIMHHFTVLETHRQIDTATFYDVTPATIFATNPTGLTNITFSDQGRNQFLSQLLFMRWGSSAQLEELVMRREAERLLAEYFPEVILTPTVGGNFNPRMYQQQDGGISTLPHGESSLTATIRLMPFIMDEISTVNLRDYLYNIFEGNSQLNKMQALYGLAMLQEPVLLYLQSYEQLENLSIRDITYIALGFAVLGEMDTAMRIYNERIAPQIQSIGQYYRIPQDGSHPNTLHATASASLLASTLGMPHSEGLYRYIARHYTSDFMLNVARLSFITNEISHVSDVNAEITYTLFGEAFTRSLSHWRGYTLQIPVQNMHEFVLTSVVGDVGATSIHRKPLTNEGIAGITIQREFFRAGETISTTDFNQGDIVRVQITIDYSAHAMGGSYVITDFLPAGLVAITDSGGFGFSNQGQIRHIRTEGQRIMFFDHNRNFNDTRTYYYYARVINPGTFLAEGTMVQNLSAQEYFTIGTDEIITIRE